MNEKMRPAGKNVLILPFSDNIRYKSIHLPDSAKAKANDGIVIAIGCWVEWLRPGDWTVFSRKQAHEIDYNGVAHIIIDERACIVTLEDGEEQ